MTTAAGTKLSASWRTSSHSTGGNECVEVAQTRESCLVRDSRLPDGTRLAIGRLAWTKFTRQVKDDMIPG